MAAQRALLVFLAAAPQLLLCQESCPAGSSAAACRGEPPAAPAASTSAEAAAPVSPKADVLAQEIEELEGLIRLSKDRVGLLEELRDAVRSGMGGVLPEVSVRALKEKMPHLSSVPSNPDTMPTAISEDYIVSKAVIPQQEAVAFVRFLPLRSPRTTTSSQAKTQGDMPSTLLIALQTDGEVRLFTPSGEMVLSFSTGHDNPVTHLASSLSHDEYLIITGDAGGNIRVHRVQVRQKRLSKEEKRNRRASTDDKVSQYISSQVNATTTLQRQMNMPASDGGDSSPMTALVMASQGGSKFFLAGDASGKVTVFTKNGTLRAQVDAVVDPDQGGIVGLHSQLSSVIYRSVSEWGYIDLEKMEARPVSCPHFEGRIVNAVLDSQQASRVMLADEAGQVWVFSVKNKKECTLELRYASLAAAKGAPVELASVKGFALGLERASGTAGLTALNMSQIGRRKGELSPPPQPVVWQRSRAPVRSWSVHKRHQQGDLIALLSEDGSEIEIMELFMTAQAPKTETDFGNFKMPVVAVAIVLVLGYQWMKNKGKLGGAFGAKKPDFGGKDFRSALLNKRRGGLAGLAKARRGAF